MKPEKITPPPFDWRVAKCDACGGDGRVVEFRRWSGEYLAGEPVEVTCDECEGSGELGDMPCVSCDRIVPLNADDECEQCSALTHVTGDPLLRRVM